MTIHQNGFSQWLSAGIIFLLVGGTFAAKAVFLVDNDDKHQAELNPENWRIDSQSALTAADGVEKLAYKYIDKLTQLPEHQAWCGSSQEISLVLAKAKSLHSIELNNLTQGKADIIVKLPNSQSKQPHRNLRLYVNPADSGRNSPEDGQHGPRGINTRY